MPAGIAPTPPGVLGVYVDGQTPVTLVTLQAEGALGTLSFGLAEDAQNVAEVETDGRLVVINLLEAGERATVTVTMSDSGSDYLATMGGDDGFLWSRCRWRRSRRGMRCRRIIRGRCIRCRWGAGSAMFRFRWRCRRWRWMRRGGWR